MFCVCILFVILMDWCLLLYLLPKSNVCKKWERVLINTINNHDNHSHHIWKFPYSSFANADIWPLQTPITNLQTSITLANSTIQHHHIEQNTSLFSQTPTLTSLETRISWKIQNSNIEYSAKQFGYIPNYHNLEYYKPNSNNSILNDLWRIMLGHLIIDFIVFNFTKPEWFNKASENYLHSYKKH